MNEFVLRYVVSILVLSSVALLLSFVPRGFSRTGETISQQIGMDLDLDDTKAVVRSFARLWRSTALGALIGGVASFGVLLLAPGLETSIALAIVMLTSIVGALAGSLIPMLGRSSAPGPRRRLGDFVAWPFTVLMHILLLAPLSVVALFVVVLLREPVDFAQGFFDPPERHFPLQGIVMSVIALVAYLWFQLAGRIVVAQSGGYDSVGAQRAEDLRTRWWVVGAGGLFVWASLQTSSGFSDIGDIMIDRSYQDALLNLSLASLIAVALIATTTLVISVKHKRTRTHMQDRLWGHAR